MGEFRFTHAGEHDLAIHDNPFLLQMLTRGCGIGGWEAMLPALDTFPLLQILVLTPGKKIDTRKQPMTEMAIPPSRSVSLFAAKVKSGVWVGKDGDTCSSPGMSDLSSGFGVLHARSG